MLAGDAAARLDFLAVLRVSGADAPAWLQGQLTADVDDVGKTASRLAAWCSPKGRVLAVFRLLADPAGGGYLMICERWFVAHLLARMRMFILRAEARIDDASEALGVIGVAGTRALPDRTVAWARAAGVDDAAVFEEVAIARVPGRHRRFIVTGPPARIASMVPERGAGPIRRAGPGAWRLADICAGVARIAGDAAGVFLPQMLNLDRLRGVSFEKGCYVGQEIVARAQHLGRIKRRACIGRTSAAAAGDPVVETTNGGASKVGDVVAAEPHPGGGYAACVVLDVASVHSPTLRVGGAGGVPIRLSLPEYMEPPG